MTNSTSRELNFQKYQFTVRELFLLATIVGINAALLRLFGLVGLGLGLYFVFAWYSFRWKNWFRINLGILGVIIILLGALLPTVQVVRGPGRIPICKSNLRQITLAWLIHHTNNSQFPRDILDNKTGTANLSWRVDLLPALGESGLYEIMDLKKPWNHLDLSKEVDNRLISQRSVTILTCPADTSGNRNRTNYFAVRGKDTCWPDEKLTLADVSDGPSGTLVLLESHTLPTVWSQPQDLDFHKMRYEVNGAGAGISSPHGATANAAFVDGSIHALSNKIDPQVLEELLHRRDGNPHVKSGWNK